MPDQPECPLCNSQAETLVWNAGPCRVILVSDADYPGYCRVVWNEHVAEMTDLSAPERAVLLDTVCATEAALRALLQPDKINLASLGNMVPHLHWHIIPRFRDDRHYPQAIWGTPQRDGVHRSGPDPHALAQRIAAALNGAPATSIDNQQQDRRRSPS
ncbi:MAG: HIT family protein [Rhodocyclales bacterium]|nr:HIT family protein [Rhodocyclales bacterium]